MLRTANPALKQDIFLKERVVGEGMTVQGTVNKTGILLLLVLVSALYTWRKFFTEQDLASIQIFMWGGLIGGLIFAFITIFKKTWAPYTSPIYALCEGLFLGGISAIFEMQFPGIVIHAVGLTFGTLACLLLAYKTGLIKVTENFKLGVIAATGAVFLVYLIDFILGFFGVNVPFIHSSGLIGIGISIVIVVIAALNLVLDFDFIEKGAEHGAPKFMEWYAAFGLLVTLVWLYLEILRLLAKLRSRR